MNTFSEKCSILLTETKSSRRAKLETLVKAGKMELKQLAREIISRQARLKTLETKIDSYEREIEDIE